MINTIGTGEIVRYVDDNGTYQASTAGGATITLKDDADTAGVGNTFTFWIVKSSSETDAISAPYTVNWTMGEASTAGCTYRYEV